jgi:Na+/H+ antiporter NhaD/arsenite permease-like protein
MMYYAITVFVVAYVFIISERFNKTTVALVGAGLMVCLPVIDSPDVLYSQDNGIDWDVIFLMLGMMMIISILRQTVVFEYLAIWAVKRANGSPLRIMILLMVVMALASAILPNVVSVLLIAPVTLLVCDALDVNPGTAADGRGVRLQHRRRGDTGWRSAEHHHRRAQVSVLQRLPGEHGLDRRHCDAGPPRRTWPRQ